MTSEQSLEQSLKGQDPQSKPIPNLQGKQIMRVAPEILEGERVGLSARIKYTPQQANELFHYALKYNHQTSVTYPFSLTLPNFHNEEASCEFRIDRYTGIFYIIVPDGNVRRSLSLALRDLKRLERYVFHTIIHDNLWFEISSEEKLNIPPMDSI